MLNVSRDGVGATENHSIRYASKSEIRGSQYAVGALSARSLCKEAAQTELGTIRFDPARAHHTAATNRERTKVELRRRAVVSTAAP